MSGSGPSRPPPAPAREATRRLFFAFWPDAGQRDALAQATQQIVQSCGGRPLPAQKLHVTLAFLGSVPVGRVAELGPIARRVAEGFALEAPAPLVRFDRLEHWPRPQILVALGSEERTGTHLRRAAVVAQLAAATALAATLKDASAAAGFSPDLKPFRAHVTVARKVPQPLTPQAMPAVQWRFDAFALVESRTHPSGPVYSVVESYPLVDAEKARE